MDWQKIGRNEPCPCGSGKKYKKCCGEHNPDALNRKDLIRENVFAAIEAQMRDSDPPETKQTFDRLIAEGCIEAEAMDLIGVVLTAEIFRVLKKPGRTEVVSEAETTVSSGKNSRRAKIVSIS